ncbi:MAG: hypothetical protein WC756_07155 [Taibaiella sp.]
MKSFIPDYRIEAANVLIEMTIQEYLEFAEQIIDKNEYQRKKVIKSNIQDTLKADLLKGCTIPPIVLAVKKDAVITKFDFSTFNDEKYVLEAIEKKDILILDGLQRTFVMIELSKEIKKPPLFAESEKFLGTSSLRTGTKNLPKEQI